MQGEDPQHSYRLNLGIDELIDETKYSSIRKLYRVTSYVKRFIHNIRNKENPTTGELTYAEVSDSELEWIRILQKRLVNIKNYEKLESQLRIYRDNEGFLRSKGRIDNAEFPIEVIKPMVLPKNEHLSRLYVMDAHSSVFHNGVNDTMAYIRKKRPTRWYYAYADLSAKGLAQVLCYLTILNLSSPKRLKSF